MKKIKLKIEGMSCTSCAINIEKALQKMPELQEVKISFTDSSGQLKITDENKIEQVLKTIKNLGYDAHIDQSESEIKTLKSQEQKIEDDENFEKKHLDRERRKLILSWIITIPLAIKMILSMVFHLEILPFMLSSYFDLILSGIVIFIIGFDVIKATFFAIKNLSFTMDSLIGIGTIASFITGLLRIFKLNIEDFSIVGAMIMSINHIGNYLKQLSTGKASMAIKKLLQLGAKTAHKIIGIENDDEIKIVDVDVQQLKIDDIVLVKPGEKIPSDGIIIEGNTSIDESIATGESMPVDKKKGDKVIGSTINMTGLIKVKIEKVGKDTFLSQVIELVKQAQADKVPIQQLADRITSYFVPIIIILSFITFLFWFFFPNFGKNLLSQIFRFIPWMINLNKDKLSMALFASIATLVIACPCALGLATPTALMVGMGKAALNGILIRKGEAIQRMKEVTTVVFDKTGTITKGNPSVVDYVASDENLFFTYGYALEKNSNHPLARSIVRFIEDKLNISNSLNLNFDQFDFKMKQLKLEQFEEISGRGIKAIIDGKSVYASSIEFIKNNNIQIDDIFFQKFNQWSGQGYTVVVITFDNKVTGGFGISDTIKEEAKEAIGKLAQHGLKTVMLTGDNELSAKFIAEKASISKVFSKLLPEDKINIIKRLQKEGEVVAMVGDGINDAPALRQADVGIAIGTGTDIAIESADITLSSGNLNGIYNAFCISEKTFNKIKQNLFWAFFYNIIAIPLAMLGILNPVVAELAMAFSSINVVTNSLRLNRIKF